MMRRLKQGRLMKIVGALIVGFFGIVIVLAVLGSHFEIIYPLAGYIKGHPEYCTYTLNDNRKVRLVFTPYAKREQGNGHPIDPNNWENEPFSHDFLAFQTIVIPAYDYEITHDGGISWNNFWRYENLSNEYPECDSFGSLDADNFWVWTRSEIAITHDGGATWIFRDGRKDWNLGDSIVIQQVSFDSPENGQITLLRSKPTLLTTDGGRTWYPDPNWTAPTA
jgi:hypothetical protein